MQVFFDPFEGAFGVEEEDWVIAGGILVPRGPELDARGWRHLGVFAPFSFCNSANMGGMSQAPPTPLDYAAKRALVSP